MSYLARRRFFQLVLVAAAACALPGPYAGTMSLEWEPASDSAVTGYRVYYGTTAGDYSQILDVGPAPRAVLYGLQNCSNYHAAVKATGPGGAESDVFSNEVVGWARPILLSASPASVEPGFSGEITLNGENFQTGASVRFDESAVVLDAIEYHGCSRMVLSVRVAANAPQREVSVEVINPNLVYGRGDLLTIGTDTLPPAIGDVLAQDVASTTARINWSTDEPSDSQVYFRPPGEEFLPGPLDPLLVESHSVQLKGLSPTTRYSFYVASTDLAGNRSSPSAIHEFTTEPNDHSYLRLEAELGALHSPIGAVEGAAAFRGAWVSPPDGTPRGTLESPNGTLEHRVFIPGSGTWYTWFRIFGPSFSADSWFETVDDQPSASIWNSQTEAWQWIAGRSYSLGEGLHRLVVGGREAGARLDRILLTDDPDFVPTERPNGDMTPPPAIADLSAQPADRAITLSWSNPLDGDLERVVVRYRLDERFPLSPWDGYPLLDRTVAPGGSEVLEHVGLTNGATVRYSVFAVDLAGNVSDARSVESTPAASEPTLERIRDLRREDRLSEAP